MRSRKICLLSRRRFSLLVLAVAISLSGGSALAQTTAFTYQGRLTDGGTLANGSYDLQFALWDTLSGGSQIGATQNLLAVQVSNGVFTVTLDFGASAFPGADRFLEISARLTGASAFTLLTPRRQITSTPYAVRSANATLADTSTNATQLGGVGAGQYVQTSDSRLTDSRSPTVGSSNYIQNTSSPQASANFNINGDGTAGGTLSGNIVNATTRYKINGNDVFSITGGGPFVNSNTFAGVGAGLSTTPSGMDPSGNVNTFVGFNAGRNNTTGQDNSFFGWNAGSSNTTGVDNTFIGLSAGLFNVASKNTFVGSTAGASNTTGVHNSFVGYGSGSSNMNQTDNTFLGYFAGLSNGNNDNPNAPTASFNTFVGSLAGLNNTTGGGNTFIGSGAGSSNTAGVQDSFLGTRAGNANTGSFNSFFGNEAGISNTTAGANSFFGTWAGHDNVTGDENAFFGRSAGYSNTSGRLNSYYGYLAGSLNVTGTDNSFFGHLAGSAGTGGSKNSFFGSGAGTANSADGNSFFGFDSGLSNSTGSGNSFFGLTAGKNNSVGALNAFFGWDAGFSTVDGSLNSFFGDHAGITNKTGSRNTTIGTHADVSINNLTNATAIGADAQVSQNNSLVLGSINGVNGAAADTFVGIGTTAPGAKLHVSGGAILLDNNQGLNLKSNFGAPKRVLLADTSNRLHIGSGGGFGFDEIRFDLGTPGTVMTMLSSGNIGIGTIAPDQLLSVNGNASKVGGGSWQVFSDERLKNIKGRFKAGLQTLRQLQPLRYEYKPNNALGLRGEGEYVGFSAQAVQRVLPEAVTRTASGYLQINNDPILWTMLNAIKEQQQEIEQLKSELQRLRGSASGHRPSGPGKAAARALRKP